MLQVPARGLLSMTELEAQRASALAQEMVELFAAYEEELTGLERDTPVLAPLRRAMREAVAEAHHWISEGPAIAAEPRSYWA